MTQEQTNYHHLFGLLVQDFFRGTTCEVELERDLSVKSQFLDVLVIHKTVGPLDRVLPDGLEGHLVEYNLVTFKSHREALSGWSVLELIGHYVNLRKQASPSFDDLLPESNFRLFAICALPGGAGGSGAAHRNTARRLRECLGRNDDPVHRGREVAADGAECAVAPFQQVGAPARIREEIGRAHV